jgi:hypothetical protein
VGLTNFIGYVLFSLWLVAFAVLLAARARPSPLRPKRPSGERTPVGRAPARRAPRTPLLLAGAPGTQDDV